MSMTTLPTADQRYEDTVQAFDSVAPDYDGPLGNNALVQHMRESLWRAVRRVAPPPARLLDLGCGTGLDAVHFACQGYDVTAIDGSASMLAQTSQRAIDHDVASRVSATRMGIQDLGILSGARYDVIYSDMGALNCLPDLAGVARACAGLLKPGGRLIFAVMGRVCPWELIHGLVHADLRRTRLRFASAQVPVSLNGHIAWTRYYTPAEFRRSFASAFQPVACRGLGLFTPPPYMIAFWERHPLLFWWLGWLDRHVAGLPLLRQMGDHFLVEMRRHV
jgi:SAM-dependent methyltransferase